MIVVLQMNALILLLLLLLLYCVVLSLVFIRRRCRLVQMNLLRLGQTESCFFLGGSLSLFSTRAVLM